MPTDTNTAKPEIAAGTTLFRKLVKIAMDFGTNRFGPRRSSMKKAAKKLGVEFPALRARKRNYLLGFHPANRNLGLRARRQAGLCG